jgi:5-methylcytosine-specific restriction endonuclease McrA
LAQDRFRCTRCPSEDNLAVHHLTYERLGSEHPDDLITLCRTCHKLDHGRDPSLPPAMPASFYEEKFHDRQAMLIEQEKIAEAAGIDLDALPHYE